MCGIILTNKQEMSRQNLINFKHHCLFYKPGKGKTYPAVFAANDVNKLKDMKGQGLILSKKKIIDEMWLKEIQHMLPKNTLYCGVELLTRNDDIRKGLLNMHIDWIIVDEAHLLKNPTSEQSKIIYKLTAKAEFAWGLTGTPRCNSDYDIFGIFWALNIQNWGTYNKSQFESQWCVMELQKVGKNGPCFYQFKGIKHNMKKLWEASIATAADFSDYEEGDLHKDQKEPEHIALPFIPSKEYKNALKGFIDIKDNKSTMIKLTALHKAHQAANGFLYLENKTTYIIPNFINSKVSWIINKMSDEKKTIIVYRFQEDLNVLQKVLPGTTDVETFKTTNIPILFMQASQGVGINVQIAKRIIFYNMDYSYVNFNQMIHRAVRIGQDQAVEIYVLYYDKSIEAAILMAVNKKISMADTFYEIANFILKGGDELWQAESDG